MEDKTDIVELTEREKQLLWYSMQHWNMEYSRRQSAMEPDSEEWAYFQKRIEENVKLMEKLR